MSWKVLFHPAFEPEFHDLPHGVQDELLAYTELLVQLGPNLGRPHVDTLKGSRHPNLKELRFKAADGVWRVAFAFDPGRNAILLIAGDKTGVAEGRFYRKLIRSADERLSHHLDALREKR